MPPVVLAVAAVAAVGLSAYGAIQQSNAAKAVAAGQKQQEALQQASMNLDNRRRRIEAIRQGQLQRSKALAASVGQGAGTENSGLAGGYGQIAGEENKTLLGLSESLNLGQQGFAVANSLADARSEAATGAGLSSLGNSIISSLGPLKDLSGGFNFSGVKATA